MQMKFVTAAAAIALGALAAVPAHAVVLSDTDFDSFTAGNSVDGQGGWSSTGPFDDEVVDVGGDKKLRLSNSVTSGSFGDQTFAPRPGGIVTDSVNDPVNGNPNSFAGESSTGAAFNRFFASFDVMSATGAAQDGLFISVSGDNGQGGRQSYFGLEDSGAGINIITHDLTSGGAFSAPIIIGSFGYGDEVTLAMEIIFNDGSFNDVANYFIDGTLVHTDHSWESFYENFQAASHPLGVPVQTVIFRAGGSACANCAGGGLLFDNVRVEASNVSEPGTMALLGMGLLGLAAASRRRFLR